MKLEAVEWLLLNVPKETKKASSGTRGERCRL